MVFRHAQKPGLADVGEGICASVLSNGAVILGRVIGNDYVGNDGLLFEGGPQALFQKFRPVST